MKKKPLIIIGIIALLAISIGGTVTFFIVKNKGQKNNTTFPFSADTNGSRRGNMENFTTVKGTIASIQDKTATVNIENNGGQRIVILSDTTNITKTESTSKDQIIQVDQTISVEGDKTDSGINAKTVTQMDNLFQQQENNPNGAPGGNPSQDMGNDTPPDFGNNAPPRRNQNPNSQQNGQRNGTFGTIEKIDGDSVTIKAINGDETTISLQKDTQYKKVSKGTLSDIKADIQVTVTGSADSSGIITARNIIID
jgi:hypothetical protein